MKHGLIKSFFIGVRESRGERFSTLLGYFFPELVTNILLYSLPTLVDARFISLLASTPTYAALAASNTFLHLVLKMAEALSVSTVILVGVHNGAGDFVQAGRSLRDSFWTTILSGVSIGSMLWFLAPAICTWYELASDVTGHCVPFLRLRAIGVTLMFIYFACVGFLRGIKDTRTPMRLYILGTVVFLICDYPLIFGTPYTPALGLNGSAIASILQYGTMLSAALFYIIFNPTLRQYQIVLYKGIASFAEVTRLIRLSIPVVIDKTTMAASYTWLCKMMSSVGTCGVAAFYTVKEMERLALLPAIASAQIITFLVSNSIGAGEWDVIRVNIKKMLFIALIVFGLVITVILLFPTYIVAIFDRKGDFTCLAARALPILSLFGIFDVLQLVLAGALRGAGDVTMVMVTRLVICVGVFGPLAWLCAHVPVEGEFVRFVLVFSSFYFGSALMSFIYIYRFRTGRWSRVLRSQGLL
jgi:putative MATE family efflux protein